jgi:cellulose biosynthesis protein BcsQ
MPSVFISHAHEDREESRLFVEGLRRAGIDAWYSLDRQLGSGFLSKIDKALIDADGLLLFQTESARESPWVQKELLFADQLGKPIFVAKVKPTYTEDEFDHIISNGHALARDGADYFGYSKRFAELIKATLKPRGCVMTTWGAKGGTGKSTTAAYLAFAFQKRNKKVLLIDLDPQATLSELLGVDISQVPSKAVNLFDQDRDLGLLMAGPFGSILPATVELLRISVGEDDALRFSAKIEMFRSNYDFIIFDCPPALGLGEFAVREADMVLIPLPPERHIPAAAEMGIKLVRERYQPAYPLPISILINMVQDSKQTRHFSESLTAKFPEFRPLRQVIRRSRHVLPPSAAFSQRWGPFSGLSKTAKEYVAVSFELERRLMQGRKFRAKALGQRL